MDFETITLSNAHGCEPAEGIRVLTLNRPEVMNAMNTRMFIEIRTAVADLAADAGLRVLILTGAGTKAFCTGGDLKERNDMSDETWRAQHQLIEECFLAVKDFPLPVIAAVEGHTYAGGFELALMTDFIVAGKGASFALPEVRRGIMPGGGGIQNLVRTAGMRRAKQLLFTADAFSAEQALQWSVVNEVVDSGSALSAAVEIAKRIGKAAPMSVRYAKLAASRGGEVDFHTGYMFDIAAYNVLVASADRLEGVRAFNEKREPRWSSR